MPRERIIKSAAFAGDHSMTEYIVPEGIESIGEGAFYHCTGLRRISLPKSLIYIGDDAFARCSSLEEITLPEGLEYLGNCVFDRCIKLKELSLPDSLIDFGLSLIHGCTSLSRLSLPSSLQYIDASFFNSCTALKEIEIRESPKSHSSYIFEDNLLLSSDRRSLIYLPVGLAHGEIEIPDGIAEIMQHAIDDCHDMTKITLPSSIEHIAPGTFCECSSLKAIQIKTSTNIHTDFDIHNGMLWQGKKLICCPAQHPTQNGIIIIPPDTEALGESAFEDCRTIKEVIFEGYMLEIPNRAFYKCTGLERITLPEGLEILGERAFEGCCNLKQIDNMSDMLASVGRKAFQGCASIESLSFGNQITEIPDHVASGCTSLKSIYVGDSVKSIGNGAFYGCESLTNIDLPDTVESIGSSAFGECSSLTSIDMPKLLKFVGSGAFYGNENEEFLNLLATESHNSCDESLSADSDEATDSKA